MSTGLAIAVVAVVVVLLGAPMALHVYLKRQDRLDREDR